MALPRAPLAALLTLLLPLQAVAQDAEDALLAPLTPARAPAKKAAARPAPAPASEEDELLAPLVTKPTGLQVRVPAKLVGARLRVDGEDCGVLPGAAVSVRPGTHHVLVQRPGYRDFSTRVRTPEGKVTELSAQPVAVAGVLSVSADVPGAVVRIDGKPAGLAPLADVLLVPGPHEVVVYREGFLEDVTLLHVRAGRDYPVRARLKADGLAPVARSDRPEAPAPLAALTAPVGSPQATTALAPLPAAKAPAPWFKRWYVWAGVGAVATAAVVGTVAATRGGGVGQPFSPGEVCGGNCDGVLGAQPRAR